MQLEKALTDASRREFRVRITVLVLWLLCLIIPFFVPLFIPRGRWRRRERRARGFLIGYPIVMYVLLIVTIVETVSYFIRFLPARLRAGSTLNRDILHDLDRRITDLASRIDRERKSAGADAMTIICPRRGITSRLPKPAAAALLFLVVLSARLTANAAATESPQIEECRAGWATFFNGLKSLRVEYTWRTDTLADPAALKQYLGVSGAGGTEVKHIFAFKEDQRYFSYDNSVFLTAGKVKKAGEHYEYAYNGRKRKCARTTRTGLAWIPLRMDGRRTMEESISSFISEPCCTSSRTCSAQIRERRCGCQMPSPMKTCTSVPRSRK